MQMRCPHCMNAIELVEEQDWGEITCPSCGTHISVTGEEETRTHMPTREKLAHFELLERVGMGHFGAVWRARDEVLDRIVALKVSRECGDNASSRWSFLHEARAVSQLEHPHIVPVYEIGRAEGHAFIVSQFIDGLDLRRHLKRSGKMDPRRAAEIARDVASALAHAHRHGILHRDIKSGNILLDGQRRPYLTDFGLAKREGGEVTVTRDGEILGTPAYMAPEQAAGRNNDIDARSDIYALGTVLYEMLTGQLVFRGGEHTLIYQVLYEEPRSPRDIVCDVPADLATICLKCLEKEQENRYQTAEELAEELDRFLRNEPIQARPPSAAKRVWRWCRREPYKLLAAVATMLAVFLLGVVAWASAYWRGGDLSMFPPWAADRVRIILPTKPPGGKLLLVPLDPDTFQEHPEHRLGPFQAGSEIEIPSGWYLVVAYQNDRVFHEVYRLVPRAGSEPNAGAVYRPTRFSVTPDGVYKMEGIRLFHQNDVADGMAHVPSGTIRLPSSAPAEPVSRTIPAFYADRAEFTYEDRRENGLAPTLREQFSPQDDFPDELPVTNINLYEALAYAEKVGKRLPYLSEFIRLARERSLTAGTDQPQPVFPVREPAYDPMAFFHAFIALPAIPLAGGAGSAPAALVVARGGLAEGMRALPMHDVEMWENEPVYGLRSNAHEWVLGPVVLPPDNTGLGKLVAGTHVVWTGRTNPGTGVAFPYVHRFKTMQSEDVGFRCVRSEKPRLLPADFIRPK